MSPIDYLRGVVLRDRKPPPTHSIPWTNAMTTTGTCIHAVIYSRCYCDLRKQTTQ